MNDTAALRNRTAAEVKELVKRLDSSRAPAERIFRRTTGTVGASGVGSGH
jgi:hypothetical protein